MKAVYPACYSRPQSGVAEMKSMLLLNVAFGTCASFQFFSDHSLLSLRASTYHCKQQLRRIYTYYTHPTAGNALYFKIPSFRAADGCCCCRKHQPSRVFRPHILISSLKKNSRIPCFDRASIGAASSVTANRVWLPG